MSPSLSLRALLAAAFALVLPAAHAVPARAIDAPAAAAVTLEVCQTGASGSANLRWRYAGLVAVRNGAATHTSVVRIGYWIQNRVAGVPYLDALEAQEAPLADAASTAAKVTAYSIEAPPLPAGALRAMARVRIDDALNAAAPAIVLEPTFPVATAICRCAAPARCVRPDADWAGKPALAWPGAGARATRFYASGLTWQQILEAPGSDGDAYLLLARQAIAAQLNKANGASLPAGVQNTLDDAAAWFAAGARPGSCGGDACAMQKVWAAILDTYNRGQYPGAPRQCGR